MREVRLYRKRKKIMGSNISGIYIYVTEAKKRERERELGARGTREESTAE